MHRNIAIIGSGVSGLAAAIELSKSNLPLNITVFEERQFAGGRTRSFVEKVSGDTIDNGQHLMMGCYTSTIEYLKSIGTAGQLAIENPLSIPYYERNTGYLGTLKISSSLPIPSNLLFGIFQTDLLSSFEKFAALRLGKLIASKKNYTLFINKTCAEVFAITKQPDSLVSKLWEPIILATINSPIASASAEVFIATLRTVFLTDRSFSALLIPKVGLTELLIDPAITALESASHSIRLGEKVLDADMVDGKIKLQLQDKTGLFDAVIIAASPMPDWATKFLPTPLPKLKFSPIVNIYLWLDTAILEQPINGFIGTTLHWCFPKPTKYAKQLLACTVSAADALLESDSDEIAAIIENDLRSALPMSKFNRIHSLVMKEKRATYLLDPQLQHTRPSVATNFPNIAIASDLSQNGLPMTIEGAIRNGNAAAISVLKSV